MKVANADLVILLLQHHADPNYNVDPNYMDNGNSFHTDTAIRNGLVEILQILLDYGVIVKHGMLTNVNNNVDDDDDAEEEAESTALTILLQNRQKSRDTKLSICRMLIEHAKVDLDTGSFLQYSLELAIKQSINDDDDACRILLEAGMDRSLHRGALDCAIQVGNESVCRLLVQYGADPFPEEEGRHENNEDQDDEGPTAATAASSSPFLAAARQSNTNIFEYFLELWDERFTSTDGKNRDGDYPIHVVCCDAHVSLQAIMVLVAGNADALAVVDGEQGLLPFHFAAMWDTSLDVIFYLLQHCPDALGVKVGGVPP